MAGSERVQLCCRWTVQPDRPPQRTFLGGRREMQQRLHRSSCDFDGVAATSVQLDELGNPVTFTTAIGVPGTVQMHLDVSVRATPLRSALDRPWEHAVVHTMTGVRRIDETARLLCETSESPVAAGEAFRPYRSLAACLQALDEVFEHDIEGVMHAVRSKGLAARLVAGITLGTAPTACTWYQVYTPDWGWQAPGASTSVVILTACATAADLARADGAHRAEIAYESFRTRSAARSAASAGPRAK